MAEKDEEKRRQDLQEKFVEFQTMQQKLSHVQKQVQQAAIQKQEIESLQQSLTEIGNIEEGAEMFVPVCSGIFAKAKIVDGKNLLVNVGNNVVVNKEVGAVKEMIAKQSAEIEAVERQLKSSLEIAAEHSCRLENELNLMLKEEK